MEQGGAAEPRHSGWSVNTPGVPWWGLQCCCRALSGWSWWKGLTSALIIDCLSGSWQGWAVAGRGCSFTSSLPTQGAFPCWGMGRQL